MVDIQNPRCGKDGCMTRRYKNELLCDFHIREPSTYDQIKALLINLLVDKFESDHLEPVLPIRNKKWCN